MVNRGRGIRYGEGKKVMSLRDFRVLGEECSCRRKSVSSKGERDSNGLTPGEVLVEEHWKEQKGMNRGKKRELPEGHVE